MQTQKQESLSAPFFKVCRACSMSSAELWLSGAGLVNKVGKRRPLKSVISGMKCATKQPIYADFISWKPWPILWRVPILGAMSK